MKRHFLRFAVINLFTIIPVLSSFADDPDSVPPPPPGGGGGTPVGAPIDGGIAILLVLGAAYAGWKLYRARKQAASGDAAVK